MTGRKKDSGDDDYNDHGYDDCDGGNTQEYILAETIFF